MLALALLIDTHRLDHLIGRWGYALVLAAAGLQSCGVPLPGTTVLIAAALYAGSTHHLALAGVVIAGAAGAILGGGASYLIGRGGGEALLRRHGRRLRLTPRRLALARSVFRRHGEKIVFAGRFITGLRNLTGFLAGVNRMPAPRFLLFSGASAAVWAAGNGAGYYYFGDVLRSAPVGVDLALAILGVGWIAGGALLLWRSHVIRRAPAAAGRSHRRPQREERFR